MHVVVNAAVSADGKLSTRCREQIAISGSEDFERVDRLRADSDAVVVGIGTVLADDPHLTLDEPSLQDLRERAGRSRNPARVVVDSRGRTPPDARIVDDAATTYVLTADVAPDDHLDRLWAAGAEVIVAGEEKVDLAVGFEKLAERGIESVMVEGGGEVIFSLFESGLVDELSVFVGNVLFGGREAPTLADGDGFVEEFPELELSNVDRLDDGVLLEWTVVDDGR